MHYAHIIINEGIKMFENICYLRCRYLHVLVRITTIVFLFKLYIHTKFKYTVYYIYIVAFEELSLECD